MLDWSPRVFDWTPECETVARRWQPFRSGLCMRRTLLLLLAVASFSSPVAMAQTLRCESNAHERKECRLDTPGNLVLTRQLGTAACTEGQTWGVHGGVVWVENGCRAEFSVVETTGLVTCSSDGRRVYCPAGAQYGVRLARQISKASCEESRTWGYDINGIWVERGCAGVFALGDADHLYRRNNSPYEGSRTMGCASVNDQLWKCEADTRFGVGITRQLSDKPCLINKTWGYDDNHIWVTQGCRAEFTLSH